MQTFLDIRAYQNFNVNTLQLLRRTHLLWALLSIMILTAQQILDIATLPDADAAYCNAGKLVFNERAGGVAISYVPWQRTISNDVYFASASGFYKPDDNPAIDVGVRYFRLGDTRFTLAGTTRYLH